MFALSGVKQCDHKFIAAETRHHIGAAQTITQAIGHFMQDLVTRRVPQYVVNWFESIQIDKQQRAMQLQALRFQQRLIEQATEQSAIRQVSQIVVISKMVHRSFGTFAFGDVTDDEEGIGDGFRRVAHHADRHPSRKNFAVAATAPQLALPIADTLQFVTNHHVVLRFVPIGAKQITIFSNQLVLQIAGDARKGGIDRDDSLVGISNHDAFLRLTENARIQARHFVGMMTLGDVGEISN